MRVYLPYAKQCTTNSALSIVTSEWVFPVNRRGNGRSKMLCTYSGLIQRMACILSTPHCFHCASLRLHVWCRRQNSILGQYSYVHSSLHSVYWVHTLYQALYFVLGMIQWSVLPTVSRFTLFIVDHVMTGCYRRKRAPSPVLIKMRRDTGLQEDLQRKGTLMQPPETRDHKEVGQMVWRPESSSRLQAAQVEEEDGERQKQYRWTEVQMCRALCTITRDLEFYFECKEEPKGDVIRTASRRHRVIVV